MAGHGGEWVVIDRKKPAQAAQRQAWLAYGAWLDSRTVPRGKKFVTWGSLEKLTVPAEWPIDFDASAPPAPPPLDLPEPPVSRERRKQLADMLRGVVADIQLREQMAPTWRNMTAAQAEANLGKLGERYASEAPRVETKAFASYLDLMAAEGNLPVAGNREGG